LKKSLFDNILPLLKLMFPVSMRNNGTLNRRSASGSRHIPGRVLWSCRLLRERKKLQGDAPHPTRLMYILKWIWNCPL